MEDSVEYTESNLIDLSIFQLREIARSVGVHLPTTYKKDELIKLICQIQSGEYKPTIIPKTKKGRPPKSYIQEQKEWNTFEQENQEQEVGQTSWEKGSWLLTERLGDYSDDFSVAEPDENEENQTTLSGVVVKEHNGWGTVHVGGLNCMFKNHLATITANMMRTYNIQTGDFVSGLFNIRNNEQNIYLPRMVNGVLFRELKRQNFSTLHLTKPTDILPLWNNKDLIFTKYLTPIAKGQRAVVVGEKNSGKTKTMFNLATEFANQNITTIFLSLNKRPENELKFDNSNIEYAFVPFDVIPFRQNYVIKLVFERAKRLCELGRDVAIFVDDFVEVLKIFEYCLPKMDSEKQDVFDLNSVMELKKLMALVNPMNNGGSITLIGSVEQGKLEGNRFLELFDNLFNCHIYLNKDLKMFSKTNVMPESLTDNLFGIVPKNLEDIGNEIRKQTFGKTIPEIAQIYEEKLK